MCTSTWILVCIVTGLQCGKENRLTATTLRSGVTGKCIASCIWLQRKSTNATTIVPKSLKLGCTQAKSWTSLLGDW